MAVNHYSAAIPTRTILPTAPAPAPSIIPTAPKVTTAPARALTPAAAAPTPVASAAEQIAALQAQAAAQYAKVGSWSDPTITALHNQVVALQAGTGNAYNPTTGAWAPTTVTPAAAVTPMAPVVAPPTALQQMMDLIAAQQQVAPPAYKQPDYSLIPQAQKGMAATANAGDTTFLPTSHYNDRVATQKADINTQAYQAYNADLGGYNAGQTAKQNQLANMAALLPYSEMTASQKATIEQGKIEAELDRQIQATKDAIAADPNSLDNRYKQAQLNELELNGAYDRGKPYYDPNSGGSGGGLTDSQLMNFAADQTAGAAKWAQDMASKDPRIDATDDSALTYSQLYNQYINDPLNPYGTANPQ